MFPTISVPEFQSLQGRNQSFWFGSFTGAGLFYRGSSRWVMVLSWHLPFPGALHYHVCPAHPGSVSQLVCTPWKNRCPFFSSLDLEKVGSFLVYISVVLGWFLLPNYVRLSSLSCYHSLFLKLFFYWDAVDRCLKNIGVPSCSHLPAFSTSLPRLDLISNLPLSGILNVYYFHFPQSKAETLALHLSVPILILLAVGLISHCLSPFQWRISF